MGHDIPRVIGGYCFNYEEARRWAHEVHPERYGELLLPESPRKEYKLPPGHSVIDLSFSSYLITLNEFCLGRFNCSVIYYPDSSKPIPSGDRDGFWIFVTRSRMAMPHETPEKFEALTPTADHDDRGKAALEKAGVKFLDWMCICTRFY